MVCKIDVFLEGSAFLIAYSGGLDSHVLLHRLTVLRQQNPHWQLRAVHIHHGLHKDADQWSEHCQKICDDLEVELIIRKISIKKNDPCGIEAAARRERYQVFKSLMDKNENVLTAHHQNDQAETLLLQLLRGAGPKGLAGMPEKIAFGPGYHLRPLLSFTRKQLQDYAKQHQLRWLEDPSNKEISFNRNYLRHKVMPLLEERWPSASAVLFRSAENCAEVSELLNEIGKEDLIKVQHQEYLSISKLLQYHQARRFNLLRYWFSQLNLALPKRIKLEQIDREVLKAREDASPLVAWKGVEVRRYRDGLYAMTPLEAFDSSQIISWKNQQLVTLNDLAQQDIQWDDTGKLTIRFRQGGEKLTLRNRRGTHELKKLFQEWGIPPWQRDRIPLLYHDDKLIAVICHSHHA